MASHYKTDGTAAANLQPKDSKSWSLDEIQAFVGGRFEVVPAVNDGLLLVNEDGISKGLESNPAASHLTLYGVEVVGNALYVPADERGTLQ